MDLVNIPGLQKKKKTCANGPRPDVFWSRQGL